MAKVGTFVDDDNCVDCQENDAVPMPELRHCSWCKELALHACAEQVLSKGRDIWICCNCENRTVRCNACIQRMARCPVGKLDGILSIGEDLCWWCREGGSAASGLLGSLKRSLASSRADQ